MDLGATICTPKRPACGICPLVADCAGRRAGIAAELPRRAEKPARPVRRGIAYLAVRDDGAVLVETRPAAGLLGGMLGLPGSDWSRARRRRARRSRPTGATSAPRSATPSPTSTCGCTCKAPASAPPGGDFRPAAEAGPAMPTVMRKALRLGLSAMAAGPPC